MQNKLENLNNDLLKYYTSTETINKYSKSKSKILRMHRSNNKEK